MKILQWNARSLSNKWSEFKKYINENSIDIALIQETWFKKNRNYKFKNFNIIRHDREDGCGGVAIILHNSFVWCQIGPTLNNLAVESVALKINLRNKGINKDLYIYNYYVNQNKVHKNVWSNEIFQTPRQWKENDIILIGGDFNAKHQLWGNNKNCNRGKNIVEILTESPYILINDGNHTTSGTAMRQSSAIDLTLACPAMHNLINSWKIIQDSMGSDHLPIIMSIDINLMGNTEITNDQDQRIFKKKKRI